MSTCDECGGDLVGPRDKNKSGWWRDRCLPCIRREHGRALTDGGGSSTGRHRVCLTIEETDDGQYRAWKEASERDLFGRGPTPPAAVARYLDLISDRVSVRVDGGESDD